MHFFFPAQAFQLTFIPTCHIVTFKKRYRKKIQTHKDIANLAQCSAFFFFLVRHATESAAEANGNVI